MPIAARDRVMNFQDGRVFNRLVQAPQRRFVECTELLSSRNRLGCLDCNAGEFQEEERTG